MNIFTTCSFGRVARVRELIESGIDVNIRSKGLDYCENMTPLMFAVYFGQYEISKHLIEQGAIININNRCLTPLSIAIAQRHKKICELLIENGAEINYNNDSSLLFAAALGAKEICELLIGKSVEFDNKIIQLMINKGWTELCYKYLYKTSFNRRKHLLAAYDSYI
jgi:ankyrin repeat protein